MLRTPPSLAPGSSGAPGIRQVKCSIIKGLGLDFRSLLAGEPVVAGRLLVARGEVPPGTCLQGDLNPAVPGMHPSHRLAGRAAELQDEALDPLTRTLAGPFIAVAATSPSPSAPAALATATGGNAVAELAAVEEAVRRVAWGGDRRRGIARIELGGEHTGTAIVVHGEGRSVGLSVQGAAGAATGELAERLFERLRARGLDVTDLAVP